MLNVDMLFHAALEANHDLMEMLGGRVFNTARPELDEQEDKLPYAIITYEGGASSGDTKDNDLSALDSANISILLVVGDRQGLADVTELVEDSISDAFEQYDELNEKHQWRFYIDDCTPSAGPVQYDPAKPCYFQTLTYQCDTSIQ